MVTMRTVATIADRVRLARRYVRAVDLARDFRDPRALDGYVVTASVRQAIDRLNDGLRSGSTQRAFRVTGPYGSGKSSFGLFLAKLLSRDPDAMAIAAVAGASGSAEVPGFKPLLVVGRRASFAGDLVDAVRAALGNSADAVLGPIADPSIPPDAGHAALSALAAVIAYARHVHATEGNAVLVLVDEMGRYLEHAAGNPRTEDPTIFQRLAELAGGSASVPIAVVAFLHHRFSDYVAGLGEWIEAEWSRSAERFEEIVLADSVEQTLHLLSNALVADVPHDVAVTRRAHAIFSEAGQRGLFSTAASELRRLGPQLYPLHPAAVAGLASVARRFGQNERSIFGFMQALEPAGLRRFALDRRYGPGDWYRLPMLFDYLHGQGDLRLRSPDRERRWHLALDAVAQSGDMADLDVDVLKCVCLLAVLAPVPGLRGTADAIAWCLDANLAAVEASLSRLSARSLTYRRPGRDEYSLWSSSSVDLDHWLEEARARVPASPRVDAAIAALPPGRGVVAHRHYHRTGTLRSFAVRALPLSGAVGLPAENEGSITVLPVHPDEDPQAARTIAAAVSSAGGPLAFVCLHRVDPADVRWAHELAMWRWIRENCGELRVDDLARAEVGARVAAAEIALSEAVSPLASLGRGGDVWLHEGREVPVTSAGDLSRLLSHACDEVFNQTPILRNELINRAKLSTAAASARMRLLELMVTREASEHLGLDGAPPERTVHLALLHASGMHREIEPGVFGFDAPTTDPLGWRPVWDRIETLVAGRGLIRFDDLTAELAKPPYGLRAGPALPVIAAFMLRHRREIALMERGSFQPEATAAHFMRLAKNPGHFALRYLAADTAGRNVVARLSRELSILPRGETVEPAVKAVTEALYAWWRKLPTFTLETGAISETAKAVRLALKKGREPVDLLLGELPAACGAKRGDAVDVDAFVERLNAALDELSDAEPKVRALTTAALVDAFGVRSRAALREQVIADYGPHLLGLTDFRLRQFVDRAMADGVDEPRWLDGIAGLLAGRRPDNWNDASLETFAFEVRDLADRLARWLVATRRGIAAGTAIRTVHVVSPDGREQVVVVRPGRQSGAAEEVARQIRRLTANLPDADRLLGALLAERLADAPTRGALGRAKTGSDS